MVLVGVLSAGVNLAVQAYADRKSPSIQDNGGSGDGTENEHQGKYSTLSKVDNYPLGY